MQASKARTWIAGTVVVAIVILVAAWFLLVSPVLASASETSDMAVAQDDQNALERTRINGLKADFDKLDIHKAELAALRQGIPAQLDHSQFQRDIATIAVAHNVTVMSLMISSSAEATFEVPTPDTAADAPAADAPAADAPAADDPAAEPVPTTPKSLVSGMYEVPVALEVVGGYENVLSFIAELQTVNPRLVLITGLEGTALKAAEAAGGAPASVDGDLSLVLTGQMYVLLDSGDAGAADGETAPPGELPVPAPGTNPMLPSR